MSSNIAIARICQFCGNEFIARTTITRYCSHKCNSRAYKANQRAQRIEESNKEVLQIKLKPVEELKAKEYLSITEACQLLGVSRWTLWRAIKAKNVKAAKLGQRTIIKRSEIDRLFL